MHNVKISSNWKSDDNCYNSCRILPYYSKANQIEINKSWFNLEIAYPTQAYVYDNFFLSIIY